jgi:hypothetical protein
MICRQLIWVYLNACLCSQGVGDARNKGAPLFGKYLGQAEFLAWKQGTFGYQVV